MKLNKTPEELLEIASENADQAIMALTRGRDAGGAIAIATLAIAQALIAIGVIFSELKEQKGTTGGTQDGREQKED